jgi:hypothetical protein
MASAYQLVAPLPGQEPQVVLRLSDGASIPFDPANLDYQEYLAWCAEGNTPDPVPPPTRAQKVADHLAAGLTITSTKARDGTLSDALDGTYGVTGADAANLNSILTVWNDSGTFPNDAPTVTIFDLAGNARTFDAGSFRAFAATVRDFVHNANLYGQGEAESLPPNAVTLVASDKPAAVKGVTDGTDVAAGMVGEYITRSNVTGYNLILNTPTEIAPIILAPGCWDIWGACEFTVMGTERAPAIQPNALASSISLHADALPSDEDLISGTGVMNLIYSPLATGQRQVLGTGTCRSNSAVQVSLSLVAQIGVSNVNVKGYISARRVR